MSNLATRAAYLTDDTSSASEWTRDERTGAIHMRAPLTWTGVRPYPEVRINGRPARILRRPEQVLRPGYLRTCERLTPTHNHPKDAAGRKVLIDSSNYRQYTVGSVGDTIEIGEINKYPVPFGNITVVDAAAVAAIVAGDDQVSQGFLALIAPPPEAEIREGTDGLMFGVWDGPHGPEEYDIEHICDPEHPTAIAYANENPEFQLGRLGANHIAVGIPKGRGEAQAQATPLSLHSASDEHPSNVILFGDEFPSDDVARKARRFMKTKIKWSPKFAKGFTPTVAVPFLDEMEVEATDAPEFMAFLQGLQELISAMLASATDATAIADAATGEVAASEVKVAEAEQKAVEAMEAKDSAVSERDALLIEVKPLRAEAVKNAKEYAKRISPTVGLDSIDDLAAVRRAVVVAKIPALAQANDSVIEGAWTTLVMSATDSAPVVVTAPSGQFMNPNPTNSPTGDAAVTSKSRALLT